MSLKPIPADPPISGPFWELVVPVGLFVIAVVATVLLYRHFARHQGGSR